jgi:hypothetical protein
LPPALAPSVDCLLGQPLSSEVVLVSPFA